MNLNLQMSVDLRLSIPNNSDQTSDKCIICCEQIVNKAFVNDCLHYFCYVCISQWSKIRAVCPLCVQPLVCIINNVRSTDDFDVHTVSPPTVDVLSTFDFDADVWSYGDLNSDVETASVEDSYISDNYASEQYYSGPMFENGTDEEIDNEYDDEFKTSEPESDLFSNDEEEVNEFSANEYESSVASNEEIEDEEEEEEEEENKSFVTSDSDVDNEDYSLSLDCQFSPANSENYDCGNWTEDEDEDCDQSLSFTVDDASEELASDYDTDRSLSSDGDGVVECYLDSSDDMSDYL